MNPNFLLIHGEAQNSSADSLCHLLLAPVVAGQPQEPVESAPKLADVWMEIQRIIENFDCVVCSAEGYTARVLHATLSRIDIKFKPFHFCNAKALLRKSYKLISYNFQFLNLNFFHRLRRRF